MKTLKKKRTGSAVRSGDKRAIERGDRPEPVVNHLSEFRSRFLVIIIAVIVATMIPFAFFGDRILSLLMTPYLRATGNAELYLFDVTEPFTIQLKASLTVGVFAVVPLMIYELWMFVRPAIDIDKRAFIRNCVASAVFLFYAGSILTFLFGIPFVIATLHTFVIPGMKVLQGAGSYLSFTFLFCATMGLVFELPLAIMILAKLGIVSPQFLVKKRMIAVIIIWIAAAVITPTTDILTQSLVAIPLMALYEISILLAYFIVKRDRNRK
jgi:sec-independent protein translocase protein TatC